MFAWKQVHEEPFCVRSGVDVFCPTPLDKRTILQIYAMTETLDEYVYSGLEKLLSRDGRAVAEGDECVQHALKQPGLRAHSFVSLIFSLMFFQGCASSLYRIAICEDVPELMRQISCHIYSHLSSSLSHASLSCP